MFPDERPRNNRRLVVLITVVLIVTFASVGALVLLFPAQRTYVVLREIQITTYYPRTNTSTTVMSKTVLTSSAFLSTVTRMSLAFTFTSTQYSQYVMSWTATVTNAFVTVVNNTTTTPLIQTITNTYSLTTSIPITYVVGIPTYVTETTTHWTSFNQTDVVTTTITMASTSASTYTRTTWTTLTSLPPGFSIPSPPAGSQSESLIPLILSSVFLAGILILRREIQPEHALDARRNRSSTADHIML